MATINVSGFAMNAAAVEIVRTLRQRNHQAYLVGGCVRDLLLGREPADYDVSTDATPEQVMRIFPGSYAVGAQFGVVLVPLPESEKQVPHRPKPIRNDSLEEEIAVGHTHKLCVEVATFRRDVGYSD